MVSPTFPEPVLPRVDDDPHGGPDGRSHVRVDFSVNSNPFGPAPALLARLRRAPLHTYPDPTYTQEKSRIAAHYQASASHVCLGSGAAELIHRVSRCYLTTERRVLIAAPSFGEYARAAQLCGAKVRRCYPYGHSEPDVAPVLEAISTTRPTLVWLCQPNNPTGHVWQAQDLARAADACAEQGALLVLDAAYLEFLEGAPETLPTNTLQLYSLTKSFRMPGVRLGYALGPAEIVRVLERSAPPWQVGSHAQCALAWALSQEGQDFLRDTLPEVRKERRAFQAALRALGLHVEDTATHYFLLEVGDAAAFKEQALRAGIRVRDGSSFGLPSKVRLATQQRHENQRLLTWLGAAWLPGRRVS